MRPWTTLLYAQGAAIVGDRLFDFAYVDGATNIPFIYYLSATQDRSSAGWYSSGGDCSVMTSLERDVGALEARMQAVEHEIHAMRQDVREIRDALVTARGGWRTLTLVIALSVSVGATLAKALSVFVPIRLH